MDERINYLVNDIICGCSKFWGNDANVVQMAESITVLFEKEIAAVRAEIDDMKAITKWQKDIIVNLRAELAAEREKNRWIPVGDRLPEEKQRTLIINEQGNIQEFYYSNTMRIMFCRHVIYWKPFPAPPEQEVEA